jgi:hypothetical protein
MKKKIEEILDILIGEIEEGKNIDDCLKEYPEHADELRPLLLLATGIEKIPEPEVDSTAFKRTMAKVNSISEKKNYNPLLTYSTLIFRPVFLRAASIILAFMFILSITFSFSADSLPGEFLYPVKCFCEKAQLAMTFGAENKAKLHLKLANNKTADFLLTFKREEKINKELLNAMLNETTNAFGYCKLLSSDKSSDLMSKTKICCQSQLKMLEVIKPLVRNSDSSLVEKAINECSLCCSCADSCLCEGRFQGED